MIEERGGMECPHCSSIYLFCGHDHSSSIILRQMLEKALSHSHPSLHTRNPLCRRVCRCKLKKVRYWIPFIKREGSG